MFAILLCANVFNRPTCADDPRRPAHGISTPRTGAEVMGFRSTSQRSR
jgi:hypothetical protein